MVPILTQVHKGATDKHVWGSGATQQVRSSWLPGRERGLGAVSAGGTSSPFPSVPFLGQKASCLFKISTFPQTEGAAAAPPQAPWSREAEWLQGSRKGVDQGDQLGHLQSSSATQLSSPT